MDLEIADLTLDSNTIGRDHEHHNGNGIEEVTALMNLLACWKLLYMTATAASSLSSLSYPDAYSEKASDYFPYCHLSELHTESDESPVGKGVVWYLDKIRHGISYDPCVES
jgi:hypothetical protein